MSRGLPCCGNVECKCDDKGRSPDHPDYQSEEVKSPSYAELHEEIRNLKAQIASLTNVELVHTKSMDELKKMVRNKEIDLVHVSDDGEMFAYGTKGNPSHIIHIWAEDHGAEYMVVDHPNLISKRSYERLKAFFKSKA